MWITKDLVLHILNVWLFEVEDSSIVIRKGLERYPVKL